MDAGARQTQAEERPAALRAGTFAVRLRRHRDSPPTTLFDDSLSLDLDGLRVDVLYVGPAHTVGDVVVHLPERGILFGGDVLWNACTPIGWEGSFAQWYSALDRVIALEPAIVVPGHGPMMDTEGVRTLRRYFEFVESECRRFFAAGVSELEACRRIDLGPFADWTEPQRIIFNVRRALPRASRRALRRAHRRARTPARVRDPSRPLRLAASNPHGVAKPRERHLLETGVGYARRA
jgi:glyoxylase-like metal-dependent hydrolase (beta-lactamase superfamily II)